MSKQEIFVGMSSMNYACLRDIVAEAAAEKCSCQSESSMKCSPCNAKRLRRILKNHYILKNDRRRRLS